MDRLECIQYLLDNAHTGSEWEEAGMFTAIREVMSPAADTWFKPSTPEHGVELEPKIAWLNELLEQARSN